MQAVGKILKIFTMQNLHIYGATYGRDFSPYFFSLENRKIEVN